MDVSPGWKGGAWPGFERGTSHRYRGLSSLTEPDSGSAGQGATMAGDTFVKPTRALTWPEAASADWALVQQCASGDEAACTRLVTDHQRMVYQLAFHLLGDSQEALDLSQEVFLRVFRTLPSFRGQSTLRTWIYRIVVNQASNRLRWWRRRHRAQQVPIDDHGAGERALTESRSFAMPDRVLFQHEMATRVWTALNALPFIARFRRERADQPFDQRAAVILREIDGLSYDEISTALGIAVGTVKSRLARARSVLRGLLGPQ